jgi:BON domain
MDRHPDRRGDALRLGAPVQFQDRLQGRVAAIEVDEAWEVLNLLVRRGVLRWKTAVKLPFAASPQWSDDRVVFDCTSRQAFAREVPPIAAPARTLLPSTPLSLAGTKLGGLLVVPGRRLATEVLVRGGALMNRVPVEDTSFEGRMLHIATHGDALRVYLTDAELESLAREAVATTRALTGEERRNIDTRAAGGVVSVTGNVLTGNTKKALERALSRLAHAATIRIEVVDDLELELAIGQGLERAGLAHTAYVAARSSLGDVTLYGEAPSPQAVDDLVRAVSTVPGVRSVRSLLQVGRPQTATSL